MEQRFKILNALTVIVIILFIVVQGDWLYSRYKYMVQTCTDTLYSRVIESIHEYNALRRNAVNNDVAVEYTIKRIDNKGSDLLLCDIYTADKHRCPSINSLTAEFSQVYTRRSIPTG